MTICTLTQVVGIAVAIKNLRQKSIIKTIEVACHIGHGTSISEIRLINNFTYWQSITFCVTKRGNECFCAIKQRNIVHTSYNDT